MSRYCTVTVPKVWQASTAEGRTMPSRPALLKLWSTLL